MKTIKIKEPTDLEVANYICEHSSPEKPLPHWAAVSLIQFSRQTAALKNLGFKFEVKQ